MLDGDLREGGIVDVAGEKFGDGGDSVLRGVGGGDEFPGDLWGVGGDAAVDFALEIFEDFGAALGPLFYSCDLCTVVHFYNVGEGGHHVVAGEIVESFAGLFVAVFAGAEGFDIELVHLCFDVVVAALGNPGGAGGGAAGGLAEGGGCGHGQYEGEEDGCLDWVIAVGHGRGSTDN